MRWNVYASLSRVDILGQNLLLTSPFKTLGWHYTSSMEVTFSSVAFVGVHSINIGWNSFPPWHPKWFMWVRNTRVSVNLVASTKWVKCYFWVNYPFNARRLDSMVTKEKSASRKTRRATLTKSCHHLQPLNLSVLASDSIELMLPRCLNCNKYQRPF